MEERRERKSKKKRKREEMSEGREKKSPITHTVSLPYLRHW